VAEADRALAESMRRLAQVKAARAKAIH